MAWTISLSGIPSGDISGCVGSVAAGASPGTFIIRTAAKPSIVSGRGDLTLTDDHGTVTFEDCHIDVSHLKCIKYHDAWLWEVRVQDRRHDLANELIHGESNVRLIDGSIDPVTRRNMREVVQGVLTQAGEGSADVSSIPNNVFPHVCWRRYRAGDELERLCDLVGHVITLDTNNEIKLSPLGSGAPLPGGDEKINPTHVFSLEEKPEKIEVVGGENIFQSRWELEPVGTEEYFGVIEQLDDLSYKPLTGWASKDIYDFGYISDYLAWLTYGKQRRAARAAESIYKLFKPKRCIVPAGNVKVNLDNVEFLGTRAELAFDKSPLPTQIVGTYYPNGEVPSNVSTCVSSDLFEWLPKSQLVKFDYPIYAISNKGKPIAPTLYLDVAYKVRDEDSGLPWSYHYTSNIEGGGRGTYRIQRPELREVIVRKFFGCEYSFTETTNRTDLDSEAAGYVSANLNRFNSTTDREQSDLVGIHPTSCDGLISQVGYELGLGAPPITRISKNYENDIYSPHKSIRTLRRMGRQSDETTYGKEQ